MACWKGHAAVAQLLLEYRANIGCRTKTGITPLFQVGNLDCLGYFRRFSRLCVMYVYFSNYFVYLVLPSFYFFVLKNAEFRSCYLSSSQYKRETNLTLSYYPVLILYLQACRENHVDVVALLLDNGCSVNANFPNSRENPLTLAAEKGTQKFTRVLVNSDFRFYSMFNILKD